MRLHSLRTKFAIANILPILLLTPLLCLYLLYSLEHLFAQKMLQRLTEQARLLIDQVESAPATMTDAQAAQQFLANVARSSDAHASLLRADGTLLAALPPAAVGTRQDSDPALWTPALQGVPVQGIDPAAAVETVYVALPVRQAGEVVGVMRLSYALDDVRAEFIYLRWLVLGGAAATLLLGLLLGLELARTITTPLRQLTERIRGVAAGDYQARIPVQRKDEIGMLAHSFNQMAARIEETEAMRQRQLATIVHELARPLTGVRAAVETLTDGAVADHEVAVELLAGIGEEITRLERLLGTLHSLDQRVLRPLRVQPSPVDLAHVIQASVAQFELAAEQQAITLVTDIPADLPPVYVDEDRLIQLLVNLLDNALKFTPPGGHIELAATVQEVTVPDDTVPDAPVPDAPVQGDFVQVHVRDNGVGIGDDDLPHLFQQFYRGAHHAQEKRGMGLGLSICRDIVSAHGGKIWVESEPGQGATFFFTLPLASAQAIPTRPLLHEHAAVVQ